MDEIAIRLISQRQSFQSAVESVLIQRKPQPCTYTLQFYQGRLNVTTSIFNNVYTFLQFSDLIIQTIAWVALYNNEWW